MYANERVKWSSVRRLLHPHYVSGRSSENSQRDGREWTGGAQVESVAEGVRDVCRKKENKENGEGKKERGVTHER